MSNFEKYCADYRAFLDKWQAVRRRNENGDYSCGAAIYGFSCDKIISFDNDNQKKAFSENYGF